MKTNVCLMGLAALCLAVTGTVHAAVYTNAAVTDATLAEAGATNRYVAYSGALGALVGNSAANVSFEMSAHSTLSGTSNLYVGYGAGADNCSAVIDNSTVTLTFWASVGASSSKGAQGGNNCSLTIQNGGTITSPTQSGYNYHAVGGSSTSGAKLTVTGSGSLYNVSRIVQMYGTGGRITVVNGGLFAVTGTNGGLYVSGSDNRVQINGGFVALANHMTSVGATLAQAEAKFSLWNGADWVAVSSLDQTQRSALGYRVVNVHDSAEFLAATGFADPGLSYAGYCMDLTSGTPSTTEAGITIFTSTYNAVPEPASLALIAGGMLLAIRRRRA